MALCVCAYIFKPVPDARTEAEKPLSVHFIDVGQGDSIFIELPKDRCMLIDAGENNKGETVCGYIKNKGYSKIDYLLGTHPHSDHIGGLDDVIRTFEIGKIYMPRVSHTTKTFEDVLQAIKDKNCTVSTAKAGVRVVDEEDLKIVMLAPNSDSYEELNDYSAVIRLDFGETSFLFTGDAESVSEEEITADIDTDVLKVGHHGSNSSTTTAFLKRVSPEIAVISVGKDNSYSHPSQKVLNRLEKAGAEVLRTDKEGDIVIESDGQYIYY